MKRGVRTLVALLVTLACLVPAGTTTAAPPDDGWMIEIIEIFRGWLSPDGSPPAPPGVDVSTPVEAATSDGSDLVSIRVPSSTDPEPDPPSGESYPLGDPNG